MDENQTEKPETHPTHTVYVGLFSTALAVGTCIGVGIVVGGEVAAAVRDKFRKTRKAHAKKKLNIVK